MVRLANASDKSDTVHNVDKVVVKINLVPFKSSSGSTSVGVMVVVPVVTQNGNRKPPYISSFAFRRLSNVILPIPDHVAERIDKLNTVPAHAHGDYPQPGKTIETSEVEEGEHGSKEEYLENPVDEEELRELEQVFNQVIPVRNVHRLSDPPALRP
jgi:hypothetical protein